MTENNTVSANPIGELRRRLTELENLFTMKAAATDAYKEALNAAAEATGYDKKAINDFVGARMKDTEDKLEVVADQLVLFFDEF